MSETTVTATLAGRTGAVAGRDFDVGDSVRIGAGHEADVRIPAAGVSSLHARVWREDDEYWIEDAGSTNGTFVGGARIRKDRVRHLDVVTLGRDVDLIFLRREVASGADRPAPEAARIASASLAPLDDPGNDEPVEIPPGEITIGRAAGNNVVVASRVVSKVHARIERRAGALVIRDLRSANGTSVNGARIDAPTALCDGDRVGLADAHGFRVSITWTAAGAEDAGDAADEPPADDAPVFDQEWRTRLIWSAEELEALEAPAPLPVPAQAAPAPKKVAPKKAAPKPPAPKSLKKPAAAPKPKAAAAAPKPPKEKAKQPAEAAAAPKPPPPQVKPKPPPPKPEKPPAGKAKAPVAQPAGGETVVGLETMVGAPPAASRPLAVRLVGEETHTLDAGVTTIGRIAPATILVDNRMASRAHATITVTGDEVVIEDQRSVNGTFVNDQQITGRTALCTGDRIRIADKEWRIAITRT